MGLPTWFPGLGGAVGPVTLAPPLHAPSITAISTTINDASLLEGQLIIDNTVGSGTWKLVKISALPLSPLVIPTMSGTGQWLLQALPVVATIFNLIFSDGDPQIGNVYGIWKELCSVCAALPVGAIPLVRITKSFTVPLTDMPPGGWGPFGLGSWTSKDVESGTVIVTIPDGVKIDGLAQIDDGLLVRCFPNTSDGVFVYSQLTPGQQWSMRVNLAAVLTNQSPSNKALFVTPGIAGTPMAMALALDNANNGIDPSLAPFVRLMGNDSAIGALLSNRLFASLPDTWVDGGGPGSGLIYVSGIDDGPMPTTPGFTGGGAITRVNNTSAVNLNYAPGNAADWAPAPPSTQQQANDRLAAAVAGLLGFPIP